MLDQFIHLSVIYAGPVKDFLNMAKTNQKCKTKNGRYLHISNEQLKEFMNGSIGAEVVWNKIV